MPKTYSSVKEAYAEAVSSGLLDRALEEAAARRGAAVAGNNNSSHNGTTTTTTTTRRATIESIASTDGSLSRTRSFTVNPRQPSLYDPDTRSSFPPTSSSSSAATVDDEDDERYSLLGGSAIITVQRIRISSSPPPEEINLNEMSSSDLARLKVEDPFMYHSIPEVRARSYKFADGDAAAIAAAVLGDDIADEGLDVDDDEQQQQQQGPMANYSNHEGNSSQLSRQQVVPTNGREDAHAVASSSSASSNPRSGGPRQLRTSIVQRRDLAASCPAGMLADADIARAAYVSRRRPRIVKRRRLSVEAHPSLICEDILGSIVDTEGDDDGGAEALEAMMDEEERFLHALMMSSGDHSDDGEEDEEED
jgi:hypothetical protein